VGRAIGQAVSRWRPGFKPGSSHVEFVALGHVFSENFGFPCPEAYLGYGRQGTCHGRHLAWHNLIDLVRLGINILELILFY
jgi:hypothetical protein